MEGSIKELAMYRLERANEDLHTSEVLFERKMLKASINRSYYAIFHALRSITIIKGFDSSKHSGIIAFFNLHFVKEDIFDKEASRIIKSASSLREKSDYVDFYIASQEEAFEQLENARKLIKQIELYLSNELKNI